MKILVVDDEQLARERLLRLLHKIQPEAKCLEASGGKEALALVADEAPELVLLDIRMPGVDGIEVATRLDALESPPAIVFCTAYDEYAMQALQHHAVAYLLKPVRESQLNDALTTAGRVNRMQLASLGESVAGAGDAGGAAGVARKQVSSYTHRGLETLPVSDIRCFLAEQKYVAAIGAEMELLLPDTLKELESEFADRFVRVHRNALVALEHIVRLRRDDENGWSVVLDGVEQYPLVSRRHLGQVKQALLKR